MSSWRSAELAKHRDNFTLFTFTTSSPGGFWFFAIAKIKLWVSFLKQAKTEFLPRPFQFKINNHACSAT
jgi:hypothetical protein